MKLSGSNSVEEPNDLIIILAYNANVN